MEARVVRRLARRADVVIENFPPGGLEKFGLSLETMRAENPRLVTASITGFGRSGPDASAPGFDLLAQAASGLMAATGEREGGATKVGVAVSDLFAGAFAAAGVAALLRSREVTGAGGHFETDLLRASLAVLINVGQSALVTGEEAVRHGNAHPQIVPYRTFSAADGELVLAVGTDPQFARLARVLGRPEWASDPRYRTNPARVEHRAVLESELAGDSSDGHAGRVAFAVSARVGSPRGRSADPSRRSAAPPRAERPPSDARAASSSSASPIPVEGHEPSLSFPPALDADGRRLRREFDLPDPGARPA